MKIEVFTPFYDRDTKMHNLLMEANWPANRIDPQTTILIDGKVAADTTEIIVKWVEGKKTEIIVNGVSVAPVEYWRDDKLVGVVQ